MTGSVRQRGFLLTLAAEGMAPHVRAFASSRQGGDYALNVFGPAIVTRWREWMRDQPSGQRHAAIAELADLPATKARAEAVSALNRLALDDHADAVEYLCALPRSFQTGLVLDASSGSRVLPTGCAPDDPEVLLRLLPLDAPPYAPGVRVLGTPYQLGDVVSTLSGVIYRAETRHVCFPCSPALIERLLQQRSRLEQLRDLPQSDLIVRLLDFDLNHATPFLVTEAVSGGDVPTLLLNLREQARRGFNPDEVSRLVQQIAEALAFLHRHGLVHGDLKPSNVIVSGDAVKLANLGLGLAVIEEPAGSPVERVRTARGASSPLYRSPEFHAEPCDDLYSLGVVWYQLLVDDLTRPLNLDAVPELLLRCVGPRTHRPCDASAFLAELHPASGKVLSGDERAASVVSPEEIRRTRQKKRELLHGLREVRSLARDWATRRHKARRLSRRDIWLTLPLAALVYWPAYLFGRNFLLANLLGVSAGLLFLLWRLRCRQATAAAMRELVVQEIDLLALQHPDEVQNWGGTHALLNPELLPEIIAALEEDMRTLAIQEQEEQSR